MALTPPILQSDLTMAVFLSTRDKRRVLRETPVPSIQQKIIADYDRETETHLRYLRSLHQRRTA